MKVDEASSQFLQRTKEAEAIIEEEATGLLSISSRRNRISPIVGQAVALSDEWSVFSKWAVGQGIAIQTSNTFAKPAEGVVYASRCGSNYCFATGHATV